MIWYYVLKLKSSLAEEERLMQQFSERRRCPRVNTSLPLRFKKLYGDTYVDKNTVTKNLSPNGVRLKSDYPVGLNSRLFIEINLPTTPKPVRALSRVVWIKKLLADNNYELGNEFLSIKEEDAVIVSDYIKNSI